MGAGLSMSGNGWCIIKVWSCGVYHLSVVRMGVLSLGG